MAGEKQSFKDFTSSDMGKGLSKAFDAASQAGKALQARNNANKGTLARPDEGAMAIRDAQYSIAKSIPGPVG